MKWLYSLQGEHWSSDHIHNSLITSLSGQYLWGLGIPSPVPALSKCGSLIIYCFAIFRNTTILGLHFSWKKQALGHWVRCWGAQALLWSVIGEVNELVSRYNGRVLLHYIQEIDNSLFTYLGWVFIFERFSNLIKITHPCNILQNDDAGRRGTRTITGKQQTLLSPIHFHMNAIHSPTSCLNHTTTFLRTYQEKTYLRYNWKEAWFPA